jgi:hypothetical protein
MLNMEKKINFHIQNICLPPKPTRNCKNEPIQNSNSKNTIALLRIQ